MNDSNSVQSVVVPMETTSVNLNKEAGALPPVSPPEVKEKTDRESARFAELARRQREYTQKQADVKAREEKLSPIQAAIDKAKEDPTAALEMLGISFEDLTHAYLKSNTPLTAEERIDQMEKRDEERQVAAREELEKIERQTAEKTIQNFKNSISEVALASADKYELVNAHGESATELVFEVVSEFFDKHGEVLPLDEALASVESYLEEQALKFAKAKKIQAKLSPVVTQPKETVPNAERYTSEKVTLNNSLNQSAASQSSRPMTDEERRLKAISLLRWQ